MKRRTLLLTGALALSALPAHAWGPATHLFTGYFAAYNLNLLLPAVAALVSDYFIDFLYGTLSADIYVGKGSHPKPQHCHNWTTGERLLAHAQSDAERAFAWGYLAHLAADVTAHNFFVPTQLFTYALPRHVGHFVWEAGSEQQLDHRLTRAARTVIRRRDAACDRLLRTVWGKGPLTHAARLRLHATTIHLGALRAWRAVATGVARRHPGFDEKYLVLLQNVTLGVTLDFLAQAPPAAKRYDPVGSEQLLSARARRGGTRENPFRIADDLYALRVSRPARAQFDAWLDTRLAHGVP